MTFYTRIHLKLQYFKSKLETNSFFTLQFTIGNKLTTLFYPICLQSYPIFAKLFNITFDLWIIICISKLYG